MKGKRWWLRKKGLEGMVGQLNLKKDPSPALRATSPTRGEVSLTHNAFLSVASEGRLARALPLPLWERSTIRAASGRVRGIMNNIVQRPFNDAYRFYQVVTHFAVIARSVSDEAIQKNIILDRDALSEGSR